MQRRLVVWALMLLAALGVGSSVALAGGGNSGAAKMCQKGGWEQLQTATGGSFSSQTACVSYGATGGTVRAPTVTASENGCVFTTDEYSDEWTLVATGFTPDSTSTIDIEGTDFTNFVFDSSGSMTRHIFTVDAGQMLTATFTDGNGVHASVTFGPITDCSTLSP